MTEPNSASLFCKNRNSFSLQKHRLFVYGVNNEFAFFFVLAHSPKLLYNQSIPQMQRIDEENAHQIGA